MVEKDIRGFTLRKKAPACECEYQRDYSILALQKEIELRYIDAPDYKKLGPKAHNLYGMMFGNWEVLYYVGERKWRCRCTCGCDTISDVNGYTLENKTSTGHNKSLLKNEEGKTYGNLKVLEYDESLKKWKCQCKCTKIVYLTGKDLRSGNYTSCGDCYTGEDLTGQHFGEWTVIKYVGDYKWRCRCSCKNHTERDVLAQNLKNGRSQSCGCKAGEKRSEAFRTKMSAKYSNTYVPDSVKSYDKFSTKNEELIKYIKSIYEGNLITKSVIENQELDIYIPDLKIAIEFNGTFWHSSSNKDKYYHANKSEACRKVGVDLIHVYEYEWDNNKDSIKQYLKSRLCKNESVYARDCIIYKVSNEMANQFFNENHLQGEVKGSIVNIALTLKNGDSIEILSIMSFGKPRFDTKYKYELLRFATKSGVRIVGGAAKIFKCFLDNSTGSVISYCNRDKFNGSVYKALGFELDHVSDPNYVWVKPDGTILSRYQTMKSKLIQKGLGTEDMTEDEIMESLKCYKIYDSGNYVFTYKRDEKEESNNMS